MEESMLTAESRIYDIEVRLFAGLHQQLQTYIPQMMVCAGVMADTDALLSMAAVSSENRYHRPVLTKEAGAPLRIRAGRHPVIEVLQTGEGPFVPNDLLLKPGESFIHLITGPNMGGKSTFMRQIALIVLLAHTGCFVPAAEAQIPVYDRIFTRVGASDNLSRGQSTFMVEMNETASILNQLTPRSLVILDEIGRGTGTYDGMALARAITEHLHAKGIPTLFATHYHELAKLEEILPGVQNFRILVSDDGDKIVFLKKMMPGIAGKSYGIHVARMAGLPGSVTARATDILRELEGTPVKVMPAKKADTGKEDKNSRTGVQPAQTGQPDLFMATEHYLTDKIRAFDINTSTPVDALNFLSELKKDLNYR